MNAKKKGNAGENKFANWLQQNGIKAYRNSSSGANQWKSDIHNLLGINFEVKTVKKLNLLEAWKQSDGDSSLAKSIPMLAIHFDGMTENTWLMVLHSEDWIDLIKRVENAQPKLTSEKDRAIEQIINAVKLLEKQ